MTLFVKILQWESTKMKYFDFCQLSHASLTLKYQILICWHFIIDQLFRENSAERELPAVKESEVRLRYLFVRFPWFSILMRIIPGIILFLLNFFSLSGKREVNWENSASFVTSPKLKKQSPSPPTATAAGDLQWRKETLTVSLFKIS